MVEPMVDEEGESNGDSLHGALAGERGEKKACESGGG